MSATPLPAHEIHQCPCEHWQIEVPWSALRIYDEELEAIFREHKDECHILRMAFIAG